MSGLTWGIAETSDFVVASLPRSLTQVVFMICVTDGLHLSEPQKTGGSLFCGPFCMLELHNVSFIILVKALPVLFPVFHDLILCQTPNLGFLCHKETFQLLSLVCSL